MGSSCVAEMAGAESSSLAGLNTTRASASPRRLWRISRVRTRAPRSWAWNWFQAPSPSFAGPSDTRPRFLSLVDVRNPVREIVAVMSTTLLDLLSSAPDQRTAIVLPEQNIRLTYARLRDQVAAMAEGLATAGVRRGDRVGIALPNGLP